MDPIKILLERLTALLPGTLRNPDLESRLDQAVRDFFSRFELVPKQEFETQKQLLETLENQISVLESRLSALEDNPQH